MGLIILSILLYKMDCLKSFKRDRITQVLIVVRSVCFNRQIIKYYYDQSKNILAHLLGITLGVSAWEQVSILRYRIPRLDFMHFY